jgi:hypothetical protein
MSLRTVSTRWERARSNIRPLSCTTMRFIPRRRPMTRTSYARRSVRTVDVRPTTSGPPRSVVIGEGPAPVGRRLCSTRPRRTGDRRQTSAQLDGGRGVSEIPPPAVAARRGRHSLPTRVAKCINATRFGHLSGDILLSLGCASFAFHSVISARMVSIWPSSSGAGRRTRSDFCTNSSTVKASGDARVIGHRYRRELGIAFAAISFSVGGGRSDLARCGRY